MSLASRDCRVNGLGFRVCRLEFRESEDLEFAFRFGDLLLGACSSSA